MNLRPAGGTLRPGGHITCTMNLRRGCRPVTSAASRRRASGPSRPSRHVRASRRAAAGNRSAPSGFPRDSAPRYSRRPKPAAPSDGPRGAPDRPWSVTGGSLLGPAGSFTGAPTGSAQTGGLAPPALTASAGSCRRSGNHAFAQATATACCASGGILSGFDESPATNLHLPTGSRLGP